MSFDDCAVVSCGDPCGPNGFFCTPHWIRIPLEVRARLKASVTGDRPSPTYYACLKEARESLQEP